MAEAWRKERQTFSARAASLRRYSRQGAATPASPYRCQPRAHKTRASPAATLIIQAAYQRAY